MVERGVDRRANQLHNEYVAKARKVDQTHGGVEAGQIGAVERKLLMYPKVESWFLGIGAKSVKQPTS